MAAEGSDRRRSNSPAPTSPRSFYKIIVPSIMRDHKLRIPDDFAKIYESELSTFATLTVPSGQAWRVGVEKANKMIWLNDGWKEFAEHHAITCGFFLVFNYVGNSKFFVLIFDLTASEIHNPRNSLIFSEEPNHEKQCPVSNKGKNGHDDFVETLCCSVPRPGQVSAENKNFDEFLYQRIGRRCKRSLIKKLSEFAPEFAFRIHKHGFFTRNELRKTENEETASDIHNPKNSLSFSEEPNHEKQCGSNKGKRGRDDFVETSCCSVPRPGQVSSENNNFDEFVYQRIGRRCKRSLVKTLSEFAPEFAFRIHKHGFFMRNKRCKMEDEGKTVKLENVTISCNDNPKASEMPNSHGSLLDKPEKKKRNLTTNLENLQEDKEGYYLRKDAVLIQEATQRSKDVGSLFNEVRNTKRADELKLLSSDAANQRTDSNGQQLKVKQEEEEEALISVKNSRKSPTRQPVTTQEREKAVAAAIRFKPQNPFFMVILKRYNVHNNFILNIPLRFATKYLQGDSKFIRLQLSGEKQWKVHAIRGNYNAQSLSQGWSVFVDDNHLVEGDVCIFELIKVEETALKVSIFRAREDPRQTNLENL